MNKKIISGFLMFALAVFSMSSFVACKDYDEDSYTDLKARLNGEITLREALTQQVKALEEALSKIKSCTCDPSKYASKDEFDKVELKLTEIEEAIKNLTPYDDTELVAKINQLNSWLLYVEKLAKSDSVRIDNLEGKVAGWDEKITTLVGRVDSIIVELSKINTGELNDKIEKAQNTADSAANLAGQAMQKALEALELAQKDSIRLDSLEKKFNELVVRDFSKEIDSLCAVTDSLAGEIDKIKADLQKMVTGVLIQGTECPVIGYFNTPFDARALILAAYYGELESPLEFPATEAKNYVNGDTDFAKWTARNLQIIGNLSSVRGYVANQPAGLFVSTNNGKEFGNAGTLYLTVNPNTVDFEGKEITLETSLGKESFIELSELEHSTRELTFGFTRAEAADNGFYEAKATLAKQNIDKVKMNIDFAELEDRAKDLINEKNKSSVLNMASALVYSFQDVLPAYGVKASWLDATSNTAHNVYSEYALANTAIKPLSYTFLKDLNKEWLPYEDRILADIDAAVEELQSLPINERDNLKSRLNGYVTRAYNKLYSIFNKAPNLALQPCMIGIANDKATMLSQTFSKPTKVASKTLELYPTSYSLELLAPAYKKFVAVTDVFDASTMAPVELSQAKTMASQANTSGENMKRVFDQETTCKFKGEAGYIYEITYTAVDYHGKVAIKKFYVQF